MTGTKKNRLLIISAPSGTGKTTLCEHLLSDFPKKLMLSISSTTRKPRGEEENGKHYHFMSTEEFTKKIKRGDFAEYAEVHGHFYGTDKSTLDSIWKSGKSALLDIDVQGALNLKSNYQEECILIFIVPPSLE